MLDPRLIEYHLSKVQKEIGEKATLANTYFRLVKPIEESLKRYVNLEQPDRFSLIFSYITTIFQIFIEIIRSISIAVIKTRESASFQLPKDFEIENIFVSHYTYAQNPSNPDIFFDHIPSEKDLIFYHNHTLLNRNEIQNSLDQFNFRPNVLVTTKSLGILNTFSLQFENLRTSIKMLAYSLNCHRFNLIERRILIYASANQVSRQTLVNQINLRRLDSLLSINRPSRILITLEGHAYEALYIDLVHEKYSEIQLMAFQHAPIVPDQFGLMKNLLKLNSNDTILASGEITKQFFNSLNLTANVRLFGSPKWRHITPGVKKRHPITVLGAAEGTYESLENFSKLFGKLDCAELNLKLIFRVHPAVSIEESSKVLSRMQFNNNLILSHRSLEQDLEESHYCIYRSSAVAIEGLRFGVLPLYFNPNGDQGLNPLFLAKLEMPVFRSAEDFENFFLNVSTISPRFMTYYNEELSRIGLTYYSKLDPSALN